MPARSRLPRPLGRVLLLLVAPLLSLLLVAPAQAAGDDYPYRSASASAPDRWGFTARQCVSFVAWRMEQRHDAMSNRTQRWGNASDWDETARRLGYAVGSKPVAGAVAQWNAGERSAYYANGSARPNGTFTAGSYGHVGYVRAVYADGSVLVENYNLNGSGRFSTMRVKAPRYLSLSPRS